MPRHHRSRGPPLALGVILGLSLLHTLGFTSYRPLGREREILRPPEKTSCSKVGILCQGLSYPWAVAAGVNGTIFVADTLAHVIRRLSLSSLRSRGEVFTGRSPKSLGLGWEDGPATYARFNSPCGLCYDKQEDALYVSDSYNHIIRRVTPDGDVTTIAGIPGEKGSGDGVALQGARFHFPGSIAVDPDGNIYVADTWNHKIRKISKSHKDGSRVVTSLAGTGHRGLRDGPSTSAEFTLPFGIALRPTDNTLYVTEGPFYPREGSTSSVRQISIGGEVRLVAGPLWGCRDGLRSVAKFMAPKGICLSPDGSTAYITDAAANNIRSVPLPRHVKSSKRADSIGKSNTVAGSGRAGSRCGSGWIAEFKLPHGICYVEGSETYPECLIVADTANSCLRIISSEHNATTGKSNFNMSHVNEIQKGPEFAVGDWVIYLRKEHGIKKIKKYIGQVAAFLDLKNTTVQVKWLQPRMCTACAVTPGNPLPEIVDNTQLKHHRFVQVVSDSEGSEDSICLQFRSDPPPLGINSSNPTLRELARNIEFKLNSPKRYLKHVLREHAPVMEQRWEEFIEENRKHYPLLPFITGQKNISWTLLVNMTRNQQFQWFLNFNKLAKYTLDLARRGESYKLDSLPPLATYPHVVTDEVPDTEMGMQRMIRRLRKNMTRDLLEPLGLDKIDDFL
ncbi:hypothetical protein AAMO2058_000029400 [Amorphochlora amoebiformis]